MGQRPSRSHGSSGVAIIVRIFVQILQSIGVMLAGTIAAFAFLHAAPERPLAANGLGNMLVNVLSNRTVAPWVAAVPTVFVAAALFALNAAADGLRDGLPIRGSAIVTHPSTG